MNNFVKIDTALSYTTGIIMNCQNIVGQDNLYLIITNRHLVDPLRKDTNFGNKKLAEYKKYFKFKIYDERNILIPIEKITIKDMYISNSADIKEDIMVFLVLIEGYSLSLDTKIHINYKNDMEVFTEGYPSVLLNDEISNRIRLGGILKIEDTSAQEVMRYAVEEYHYYDKLSDLKIFSGFSGAPVKRKVNENEYLIGMNVSLPYQKKGENPFKLVYFIKIKSILNFLREKGVIIFELNEKSGIKIKWIHNENFDKDNRPKNILVLGGSGSGKSSFIKSFALHSNRIDASGDGQTTRCKVRYNYSIYQEFCAEIKFLREEEFACQRVEDIFFDLISYVFTCYYDLFDEDIHKDKLLFFRRLYMCFDKEKQDDFNYLKQEITEFIMKYDEYDLKERDQVIIEQYSKILQMIAEEKYQQYIPINKDSNRKNERILELLLKKEGLFDIEEFRFLFVDEDKKDMNECGEDCVVYSIINLYMKGGSEQVLLKYSDYIEQLIQEIVSGKIKYGKIKSFFEEMYQLLLDKVKIYVKNYGISQSNHKISISNELYNDNELQILTECLKVNKVYEKKNSISALVKEVIINDSLANEYAMMFNEINCNNITFIDTRGLDHIEKGIEKEKILYKVFTEEKEQYEDEYGIKIEDGIDAVLYLKKLDSGRPMEISEIIPLIYKISPQIALYTVFTGIDIFYSSNEEKIIDWNRAEQYLPKSVEYIKSNEFYKLLYTELKAREPKREIIYKVLAKNVIAFCGDYEKSKKFIESNKFNIKRLLKSIIMRENTSIDFVEENHNNQEIKRIKEKINKIIELLFEKASINEFGNTNAPATCFKYTNGEKWDSDQYDYGYYGYYADNRNRIDLCFNDAYNYVFAKQNVVVNELINEFDSKGKIDNILIGMKNMFIGRSKDLYKIWTKKDELFYKQDNGDKDENFSDYIKKIFRENKGNKLNIDPFDIRDNYFFNKFIYQIISIKKIDEKESIKKQKEIFIEYINEEKQSYSLINKQIINNNFSRKDIHELKKIIMDSDRRKYKTFREDINSNNIVMLADILFSENIDITRRNMIYQIEEFLFRDKVYLSQDNYKNFGEEIFTYFDQISSVLECKEDDTAEKIRNKIPEIKNNYLRYCFNFKDRLEENDIGVKEELVNLFWKTLCKAIEQDKNECIKNIFNTNSEIREALKITKTSIEKLFLISENKKDRDVENLCYKKLLKECIHSVLY